MYLQSGTGATKVVIGAATIATIAAIFIALPGIPATAISTWTAQIWTLFSTCIS
ncbi:hypothetical protein BDV36DRAFT_253738 [Aspergillus pseudocaelatus]|uniref:Uncharacterized protein n=1 Tax=Aspergillus pseudocaelatus TaxID=1825620 RepID=A0ABQ6WN85_9EURO|nr:hypothetical protein BDV36DRAFT_253738 [Aspergillus pseudocaelatus]